MDFYIARLLHETAKGAFGVRRCGVEEQRISRACHIHEDAFTNGSSRVAAPQSQRLDQQMRQSVQQYVRSAGKLRRRGMPSTSLFRPSVVSGHQRVKPRLHRIPLQPLPHRSGAELDHDALAAILYRREPLRLPGDVGPLNAGGVFSVYVRRHRLQPRKLGEGQHFPKPVHLNDRLDGIEPRRAASRRGSRHRQERRRQTVGRRQQDVHLRAFVDAPRRRLHQPAA